MRPVDVLARYLWEGGLDVFTDPDLPLGHLVVRDGEYTRVFLPHEVEALAATLWALGLMDRKGRPLGTRRTPWEAGCEAHEEGAFSA